MLLDNKLGLLLKLITPNTILSIFTVAPHLFELEFMTSQMFFFSFWRNLF